MKASCSKKSCTWTVEVPQDGVYPNLCPECSSPVYLELTPKEALKEGTKYDQDKPAFALLPPEALEEIAKLYTFGAKKYQPHNWRKGISYSRVFSALMRHAWAWWRGENTDPEHGLSHLTAVAWCAMTLLSFELNAEKFSSFDDRVK